MREDCCCEYEPKVSRRSEKKPSTDKQIQELEAFSPIPLPSDYLGLILESTEVEIAVDDKGYIRIWGAEGCIEMNKAYNVQEQLGASLAIGDDEGGSALVVLPASEGIRAGLYLIGFGCLDRNEGEFIAESLGDLLENETGIEVII